MGRVSDKVGWRRKLANWTFPAQADDDGHNGRRRLLSVVARALLSESYVWRRGSEDHRTIESRLCTAIPW